MDVCADLILELSYDAGVVALVDERIFGGRVPNGTLRPFLWLQRRGIEYSGALEAEAEPFKEYFDVECVSDDPAEAVEVGDAVRAALHGKSGTIGDNVYSWVGVADAAETYVPRNMTAEEYLFISSLDVEVIRP